MTQSNKQIYMNTLWKYVYESQITEKMMEDEMDYAIDYMQD